MEKISNIISFKKKQNKKAGSRDTDITYERGKYPIFEGKVLRVSAQITDENNVSSIIDYLPKGVQHQDTRRVTVPFGVHPGVLNGSEVRAYIDHIAKDGRSVEAFILEVTKGRSKVLREGDWYIEHTGFKYIRTLPILQIDSL